MSEFRAEKPVVAVAYATDASGHADSGDGSETSGRVAETPTAAIDWGDTLSDTEISVYFAQNRDYVVSDSGTVYYSEGWNAYEVQQVTRAFRLIEAVTKVTFTQVDSFFSADFVLGLDADEQMAPHRLGFFNPPYYPGHGRGMFNGAAWDREPGGDLEIGGVGFATIVHELLHGLGLAHPHDEGGSSGVLSGVSNAFGDYGDFDLNQGVFTVMSYNEGLNTGTIGRGPGADGLWGVEAGPMALDIAVLQAAYGANMTHATGDDTYDLPGLNGTGTYWVSIWDAGGYDTIRYGGVFDCVIDLRPAKLDYSIGGGGFLSAADGIAGGFTIANGVTIERAISGRGNDRVIGNDADNLIVTRAGHDTVSGGAGDDVVRSGGGNDLLRGQDGNDLLLGGEGDDQLFGQDGNDRIKAGTGDDLATGGAGDDLIIAHAGSDQIIAGAGNDIIRANAGDDLVNPGTGDDTVQLGAGSDRFVFRSGDGSDVIQDFDPTCDRLILDPHLLPNPTDPRGILDVAFQTSSGVQLKFDSGDMIQLLGVMNSHDLISAFHVADHLG
ncbi:M10 family metallopeptidase [Maritimibacter dapengensis]|uniref:M10 family metallopeptidase C-terminal domain-containing protein n=1 Tax=Maritimibacter dapengensis TaxID=2836868 RepID=A0ABS6T765_9RHOB|nr:M10 family metallopeptidase [Maritimibacter dapengensis]MBV7380177.1 M10 family metallopeptidase C-terminal domain-containing protein [Maritimibacter dapengensis]